MVEVDLGTLLLGQVTQVLVVGVVWDIGDVLGTHPLKDAVGDGRLPRPGPPCHPNGHTLHAGSDSLPRRLVLL